MKTKSHSLIDSFHLVGLKLFQSECIQRFTSLKYCFIYIIFLSSRLGLHVVALIVEGLVVQYVDAKSADHLHLEDHVPRLLYSVLVVPRHRREGEVCRVCCIILHLVSRVRDADLYNLR